MHAILVLEDITRLSAPSMPEHDEGFCGIVGRDERMVELFETIVEVAQSNAPVLIRGESGTGKELVALAIHRQSLRAHRHSVPVHCAALPGCSGT